MPKPPKLNPSTGEPVRVRLQGGPWVADETATQIIQWNTNGPSVGVIIDRLTKFAVSMGFSPKAPEDYIPQLDAPKRPRK